MLESGDELREELLRGFPNTNLRQVWDQSCLGDRPPTYNVNRLKNAISKCKERSVSTDDLLHQLQDVVKECQETQWLIDILAACHGALTLVPSLETFLAEDISARAVETKCDDWPIRLIIHTLLKFNVFLAFMQPSRGRSFFSSAVEDGEAVTVKDLLEQITPGTAQAVSQDLSTSPLRETINIAVEKGDRDIAHTILDWGKKHEVPLQVMVDPNRLSKHLMEHLATQRTESYHFKNRAVILEQLLSNGLKMNVSSLLEKLLDIKHNISVVTDVLLQYTDIGDARVLLTEENIYILIEHGHEEVWKGYYEYWRDRHLPFCESSSRAPEMLHKAVSLRKEHVVRDLLTDYPTLARTPIKAGASKVDRYPLWALHPPTSTADTDDYEACVRIRDIVVESLIHSSDPGHVLRVMRSCEKKNVTDEEDGIRSNYNEALRLRNFGLDLSLFDSNTHDFTALVASLCNLQIDAVRFERVLKSVRLPELRNPTKAGAQELATTYHEVKHLLAWLRTKNVQRICELSVLDRKSRPHSREIIHSCVKKFKIEVLDWRVLDLDIRHVELNGDELTTEPPDIEYTIRKSSILTKQSTQSHLHSLHSVRELTLYTEGSHMTIESWLGHDGLIQLTKLKHLTVFVVNDVIGAEETAQVVGALQRSLKRLKDGYQLNWEEEVKASQWTPERNTRPTRISRGHISPLPYLSAFVEGYSHVFTKVKPEATKVAVIDDGFMCATRSDTLQRRASAQIEEGQSFDTTTRGGHQWSFSGPEGHGTKMACLIASLDPKCRLYIAQVCKPGGAGLNMGSVAEAIKWAISMKVDIISLSLALERRDPASKDALDKAVNLANLEHIPIFCATMDEGSTKSIKDAFPANQEGKVISIVAGDHHGNLLPFSQKQGYGYRLLGENIIIGDLDFLEADPKHSGTTGSSVATAIAAGLASLTLSCSRIAPIPPGVDVPSSWRKDLIVAKFGRMLSDDDAAHKIVLPEHISGRNKLDKFKGGGVLDEQTAERLIRENFALKDFVELEP